MTAKGLTIEFRVPKRRDNRRKRPEAPEPVPRIARLLALAHKWEGMVRRGEVKNYAEIARLMALSRARVTQICRLCFLAPELQESILEKPPALALRRLRSLTSDALWIEQRRLLYLGPALQPPIPLV